MNPFGSCLFILRRHKAGLPNHRQTIEFAVAIQLVTEQVKQERHPRLNLAGHCRQACFVHLKEADIAPRLAGKRALGDQGGGDATEEVGALTVVERRHPGTLQNAGQHAARGGLAVRAGNNDSALRQAGC